jgi:predicted ABC-type ATPase
VSNEPAVLIILGGINGAGKSSVVRVMAQAAILAPAIFLDPDKVTAEIQAIRPELDASAANFAGLRVVSQEITRLLAARQSFMTETVLANNSYRRICLDAKAHGWIVRLLYVGVPTIEDTIARVALRVAKGGHDVPEADIRRRWAEANRVRGVSRQCGFGFRAFPMGSWSSKLTGAWRGPRQ